MKKSSFVIILCSFIILFPICVFANNCRYCLQQIDGDDIYCTTCSAKRTIVNVKSKEEELAERLEISRKNYKKSLLELSQFYLDIGNRLRYDNVSLEINEFNKIPKPLYTDTESTKTDKSAIKSGKRNIEAANILFTDADLYVYINSPLESNKKKNLSLTIERYERILSEYPESDKVSDAAYYLAEIYSDPIFAAYEKAASYYVKCYEADPHTDKPALYKAATVFDYDLNIYENAKKYYKMAVEFSPEYKYKKRAQRRLDDIETSIE